VNAAIRNIFADLVDRRLWPVAVVLVAALVAVPVLLVKKPTSHSGAPSAQHGVAGTSAPALGAQAVDLAHPAGGPVVGSTKNPFLQQHLPKATSATSGSSGALGPAKPGSGGGAGGTQPGSGATPATPGGGSTTGSGGSRHTAPGATLEVRFGLAQGRRTKHEVSPGSPLPSPTNPLLVYLGQSKDGKAAFLVSSDAQPQGDGQCKPDKSICSTLYLKQGGTEFFDVTGPTGTVQYELEVLHVKG
jgi:hypothetical protein